MKARSSRLAFPIVLLVALLVGQVVAVGPASATSPTGFGKSAPANNATGQLLSVTLSWGASTMNPAGTYQYCFATSIAACTTWNDVGTNTSVGVSGLSPATDYYWHVKAVNIDGTTYSDGSETAHWKFTTGAAPSAFTKSTPANLATGQSLSVTLAWNASTMSPAGVYEYCYATTTGCTNWQPNGSATSVLISGLSVATTYYWQVRAANPLGYTQADTGTYWSFTTVAQAGAFAKTSPANNATGQSVTPTLAWGTSAGAASYEYCYDTTNDNACSAWVSVGAQTSVALSGLLGNTTYYWHVRAVIAGPVYTYSNTGPTDFWKFTTGLLPGSFSKSLPALNSTGQSVNPTLVWGASSMTPSGHYEYCYDTTNDNACTAWVSTNVTSAALTNLAENTSYYWHVRAVNATGPTYSNGSATAFWSFKTGYLPTRFWKQEPVANATGLLPSVTLKWTASEMVPAGHYEYCYDTTNDWACSTWRSTTATSVVLSGLSPNTAYYWQVRAVNTTGITYADGSSVAFWRFTTGAQELATARFRSVGAYDGWVLESGENTGVGGATDATALSCRVGDDASDRQYRTILSFNTSRLPNDAVITRVVLKFKTGSVVGTNPFLTHGALTVDIRTGAFGSGLALQASDFEAPATRSVVGWFGATPVGGQFRSVLSALSYPDISLTGHTQFRLRFTLEDNDDGGADFRSFLCGNAAVGRDRPVLVVTYYVP